MNTLNNTPQEFNEAALAAAKKVNPDIPDDALPIVFINGIEISPDPDEVNLELGGDPDDLEDWGGMTPREVLREIENRSHVMWMPEDYKCFGFAVYDGEKFGPRDGSSRYELATFQSHTTKTKCLLTPTFRCV